MSVTLLGRTKLHVRQSMNNINGVFYSRYHNYITPNLIFRHRRLLCTPMDYTLGVFSHTEQAGICLMIFKHTGYVDRRAINIAESVLEKTILTITPRVLIYHTEYMKENKVLFNINCISLCMDCKSKLDKGNILNKINVDNQRPCELGGYHHDNAMIWSL